MHDIRHQRSVSTDGKGSLTEKDASGGDNVTELGNSWQATAERVNINVRFILFFTQIPSYTVYPREMSEGYEGYENTAQAYYVPYCI